jgi:hypothetical protein
MNIDNLLKRNLLDGQEYAPLFPSVACDKTALGSGNTFDTVKMMQNIITKYNGQTKKIAKVLQKSTLKETCDSIYWFLYNHIQYKADGLEQQLRSPACAFKQRKDGIDCKSYSIFASCILSNLGIKHHIRQIKQPTFKPNLFTHVYIVVPVNQQSGALDSGYFVIDGTTSTNREPLYTMAEDQQVQLPHFGLNAPCAKKTTTRKPAAKKPVARKAPAKKPTVRKAPAKKPAKVLKKPAKVLKKPAKVLQKSAKFLKRKPTVKKAVAKKPTVRKTIAKKPTVRKPAARKKKPAKDNTVMVAGAAAAVLGGLLLINK